MDDKLDGKLKELEEQLNKLKSAVDYINGAKKTAEAAESVIKSVVDLKTVLENLTGKTKSLIEKIDKEDQSRTEKIETTVEEIRSNLDTVQNRIESLEKNLKDQIINTRTSLSEGLKNKLSSISDQIISQKKELLINRWLMLAGLIIILAGVCFIIFNSNNR